MKNLLLFLTLLSSFNLSAQTNDYLEFNGIQDGVRMPHLPIYNTITSELTVSAWFYQDSSLLDNVVNNIGDGWLLGTVNTIVSKQFRKPEPFNPLVFQCGPYMNNGDNGFYYSVGGNNGDFSTVLPNLTINDTWQHFLMSVKNDSLKLFIDGALVESISLGSGFVFNTNPDDIEIGYRQSYPENDSYTFPGKIRHAFILNRGIEESELTTLMNCGPSLLDPNLLGYWPLDEGTGAIANDLSPNLNNGIHQETLNWVSSNLVLNCCTPTTTLDTTTYMVDDIAFASFSPVTYVEAIDSLTTQSGCDSLLIHHTRYLFSDTYCTDTAFVQDTSFVTIYDTTEVFDTTFVTIYDTVTYYDTVLVSVTDTLIIDVSLTGVAPPNNTNTIKVYPNPANDVVIIANGAYSIMSNYKLKIVNTLGQEVFNSFINIPQFQIPVSVLGAVGLYYIQIFDDNSSLVETKKLILN